MDVRTISKKELFSGKPILIFRDVQYGFSFYVVYDKDVGAFGIDEIIKERRGYEELTQITHYGYYDYDYLSKFFEAYGIKLYIEEEEEA